MNVLHVCPVEEHKVAMPRQPGASYYGKLTGCGGVQSAARCSATTVV